jgi:hypothetical protein
MCVPGTAELIHQPLQGDLPGFQVVDAAQCLYVLISQSTDLSLQCRDRRLSCRRRGRRGQGYLSCDGLRRTRGGRWWAVGGGGDDACCWLGGRASRTATRSGCTRGWGFLARTSGVCVQAAVLPSLWGQRTFDLPPVTIGARMSGPRYAGNVHAAAAFAGIISGGGNREVRRLGLDCSRCWRLGQSNDEALADWLL